MEKQRPCIVAFTLFISLILVVGLPTFGYAQSTSDFLEYENPTYGIRVLYPSDWETIEPDDRYIKVGLLSSLEGDSDLFKENVFIGLENLPLSVTLDDYTKISIQDLRGTGKDFELVESSPATLADNPAHKIIYTLRDEEYNDLHYKNMAVWTIKDNEAYFVLFTAEVGKYSDYLPTVQAMIDSFEIDTSAPAIRSAHESSPQTVLADIPVFVYKIMIALIIAGIGGLVAVLRRRRKQELPPPESSLI